MRAEFMLPRITGARPGKITMMPYWASLRLLPERIPSPSPTNRSKKPTPQAIAKMVRNERNLCTHRVRKVCARNVQQHAHKLWIFYYLMAGSASVGEDRT